MLCPPRILHPGPTHIKPLVVAVAAEPAGCARSKLGRVASQLAGESEGDPDETSRPEESTKPVDPTGRFFPRPHAKAER